MSAAVSIAKPSKRPHELLLSSASNEHYSPHDVVARARRTLGAIDLDPASCSKANEVVQARRIFTKADDGLSRLWLGRVFLNPPGAKVRGKVPRGESRSQAVRWWFKLAADYETMRVDAAIFVIFNLGFLQVVQKDTRSGALPIPLDFPICYPRDRLDYAHEDEVGALVDGESPTQASAIVFLPPRGDYGRPNLGAQYRFVTEFSGLGRCVAGTRGAS